jgi:hypothetical protein
VNGLHGFGFAEQIRDPAMQVGQGVFMFGENDELARRAVAVGDQGFVLDDSAQLGPFPVGTTGAHRRGRLDKSREVGQFSIELLNSAGCGRSIDEVFFNVLKFSGGVLVGIVEHRGLGIQLRPLGLLTQGRIEQFLLGALQPVGSAHQRLVDSFRA